MNWLSFLIGALLGWLVCWLLDYFICRPRRKATEEALQNQLEHCKEESASLRAQLTSLQDVQARLGSANEELASLRTQVAQMKELQAKLDEANTEREMLRAQLTSMQDLEARLASANLEIETLKTKLAQAAVAPAVQTTAAVQPTEVDDLTLIEGIGPKINALLNQNSIYTFAQLAATSVERLRAILEAGGPRFRLADPQTWPEQAQLARDGKWEALRALQDSLKGGRVV